MNLNNGLFFQLKDGWHGLALAHCSSSQPYRNKIVVICVTVVGALLMRVSGTGSLALPYNGHLGARYRQPVYN